MDSRLKTLREMFDFTQEELAQEFGISRQSLISLERGKCKPSIDLARAISDYFEMPIELIFYPSQNKNYKKKKENMAKGKRESTPWSGFTPFRELNRMHEEIDRMFEDSIFKEKNFAFAVPAVDVVDNEDSLLIKADLPGVSGKDIDIEVHEDYVRIGGERKENKEVKKDNYYHRETTLGSFSRIVSLPAKIKVDQAKASMKNGRLEIWLPKLELKEGKVKKLRLKN
ncbi:Hsp20 family protein [Patescibacteria group bacterium]|nr:Hsp20 family protein [Patescibacteria group bacterium]